MGWAFRLFWDLNHSFKWVVSGDFFWGTGYALVLFGCAMYIDSTIQVKPAWIKKRWIYKLAKTFTQFFLFTSISNLCDELFFNPMKVSAGEWIMAILMWVAIHYFNTYYDRLERMGGRNDR